MQPWVLGRTVYRVSIPACGPYSTPTTSPPDTSFNKTPSGSGNGPEPGTDGKARPLPNGHYESIVVAGGLTYIGSDNGTLYALGARDGTVRWQYKMGSTVFVFEVVNGFMYATADKVLYVLNSSNGALFWRYQVDKFITDVLVVEGTVYVDTAAEGGLSILYALQATNGSPLWHYTLATESPGLVGISGSIIYYRQASMTPGSPHFTQTISALRASDAHALWHMQLDNTDGLVDGPVVEVNGIVYIATTHGAIYALHADTGLRLWHVAQPSGQDFIPVSVSPIVVNGLVYIGDFQGISAYRASDGVRAWQHKMNLMGPLREQPVVAGGAVYSGDTTGHIVALRATDGILLWQHKATGVFTPLTVADGLVINDTGPAYALRASDGSELWRRSAEGTGESSPGGQPEVVGEGIVFIGSQDGSVQTIEASDGKLLWRYTIQEQAVQMPPVYGAYVNFTASTSYQQALAIVTGLGLKTFADCHPYWWTKGDDKDIYPSLHLLTVAATVNSAPLWLERLKATPGVERAEANGPHSCPLFRPGSGFRYLPDGQAGTFVRVTFAVTAQYAIALDAINALGFRLADPCYEQARARGTKPTWHSMGQADFFTRAHTLVLATTSFNATEWAKQLEAVAGIVKVEAPFKMTC